jgi:Ca2+-binding RTX toxin-like protein
MKITSLAALGIGLLWSFSINAQAVCDGRFVTIPAGTDADEVITGTQGDDVIDGGGGSDTIDGDAGNDFICGGDGDDIWWAVTATIPGGW